MVSGEVGLIGLGVMGAAIGRRLLQTRHPLRVFDVRAQAMQEFADAGATTASTAQDLAACSVVVLSLNTTAVVEGVVFGPNGLLSPDPPSGWGVGRVVTRECPCRAGGLDLLRV